MCSSDLSARGTEHDRVHALQIGADDYLVKPFSMKELVARVQAAARRGVRGLEEQRGEERPILIEITMNNSSGIYQVDGLLKAKLQGSGLEPYVEVVAHIDTEAEKKLVPIYRLET